MIFDTTRKIKAKSKLSLNLYLMQYISAMYITTNVASSNPAHGEMY